MLSICDNKNTKQTCVINVDNYEIILTVIDLLARSIFDLNLNDFCKVKVNKQSALTFKLRKYKLSAFCLYRETGKGHINKITAKQRLYPQCFLCQYGPIYSSADHFILVNSFL